MITGYAVDQGAEYGARNDPTGIEGDETEDLLILLSTVKSHHPEIQGVSVGAILSNYQRVRVEHVCRRLGLTPLCYLWQRDQGELLAEMISSGMEAILIKVAGIGLKINHLGKTLADIQPTLVKLNHLYGSHICGEGGEYETLTLDCPLFKHRIILTEVESVIHSDKDFATVAFLRIKSAKLESKTTSRTFVVPAPPLLEDDFRAVRDTIAQSQERSSASVGEALQQTVVIEPIDRDVRTRKIDSWISVANIERKLGNPMVDISIEDEVTECFMILEERLNEHSLDISHCTVINILLSSMDLFARVNTVYSSFFWSSPPARACVAVDLPHPIRIRLDCIAFVEQNPTDRQALHVQGLSYWAPANIGPYSQAITADEHVFISGQIGMIPRCLSLSSPPSLAMETALACQHVARVTEALKSNSGGGWFGHTQAALYWLLDINHLPHVEHGHRRSSKILVEANTPTLFVIIKALPKEALIEKQVYLHTGRCSITDDDDVSMQPREPIFEQDRLDFTPGVALHWQMSRFQDTTSACAIICVRGGDNPCVANTINTANNLCSMARQSLSIRMFFVPSRAASFASLSQAIFGVQGCPPTTLVPCRFISSGDADDWDYAICIFKP